MVGGSMNGKTNDPPGVKDKVSVLYAFQLCGCACILQRVLKGDTVLVRV